MNIFDLLVTTPFAFILRLFLTICQNEYWLALILFTIFTKVVLFPLAVKQKKGMLDQARIQPKIKALEKKYKDNKEKYNEELQKLYKDEKVSLFGGCLPLLLTVPILFGLYAIIREPLVHLMSLSELGRLQVYKAVFDSKVAVNADLVAALQSVFAPTPLTSPNILVQAFQDAFSAISGGGLSSAASTITAALQGITPDIAMGVPAPVSVITQSYQIHVAAVFRDNFSVLQELLPADVAKQLIPINFNFLGLSLGETPSFGQVSFLWLFPALSGGSAYLLSVLTQKNSGPQNANPQAQSQTKMMTLMSPLLSLWIGFSVPVALSIYWIANNLCSLLQEPISIWYLKRKHPQLYAADAGKGGDKAPLPDIIIEKNGRSKE